MGIFTVGVTIHPNRGVCMATWVEVRDEAGSPLTAGTPAKGEYRCAGCGYGITVYRELPRCPMCGEETWEQRDWTPFDAGVLATRRDD